MIKLPKIFSDGMILQRNEPVRIWGDADYPVTVSIDLHTTVDFSRDGKFYLEIPPHKAGGPYDMFIECAGEVIKIKDVYFGDVFLAGGQSNMALDLADTLENGEDQALDVSEFTVRMFTVSGESEDGEAFDGRDVWLDVNHENGEYVSAVASHFAHAVSKEKNVPVGIVSCNSGGSSVRAWISPETVASDPVFGPGTVWHYEAYRYSFNAASYLYNQKLTTVMPYNVKAALWYQGESDVVDNSAFYYDHLLKLLIADWRRAFKSPELPFIYAQISYFPLRRPYEIPQVVRNQQLKLYLEGNKNVSMITAGDLGDHDDLHPLNKKPVGERFALAVRGIVYGDDIVYRPPVCTEMSLDGDVAVLKFRDVGEGLYEDQPLAFKVMSDNGHYSDGKYEICGDTIRVWSDGIVPASVCFCYEPQGEVHLYSSAGLPASPFIIGCDVFRE